MKKNWYLLLVIATAFPAYVNSQKIDDKVRKINCSAFESYNQVQILAGDEHFTTLLFDTTIVQPNGVPLKKPVLYPVYAPSQIRVTRQYSLKIIKGESHDEPHQEGIYFAYGSNGDVNGNSFWSNPPLNERIEQTGITQLREEHGDVILGTRNKWVGGNGKTLLIENRDVKFSATTSERSIEFSFKLEAQDTDVVFKDTKEGLFAIRVADWLSEGPPQGHPNPPLVEKPTGQYLNSNGEKGDKVWGKRAKWVRLEGTQNGKIVGIIIMDNPANVNYPTFWHARGYGLFSANPLGQSVFLKALGVEKNPKPLNFTIRAGDTATFKYKVIIYVGHRTADQINKQYQEYISSK